jgi:hypothetical protein
MRDSSPRADSKESAHTDFPHGLLSACNPHFAWRALHTEDEIGTMFA